MCNRHMRPGGPAHRKCGEKPREPAGVQEIHLREFPVDRIFISLWAQCLAYINYFFPIPGLDARGHVTRGAPSHLRPPSLMTSVADAMEI